MKRIVPILLASMFLLTGCRRHKAIYLVYSGDPNDVAICTRFSKETFVAMGCTHHKSFEVTKGDSFTLVIKDKK